MEVELNLILNTNFCFVLLCIHNKGGALGFFLDGKKKSHQVFSQSILGLGCSEFIIYCYYFSKCVVF